MSWIRDHKHYWVYPVMNEILIKSKYSEMGYPDLTYEEAIQLKPVNSEIARDMQARIDELNRFQSKDSLNYPTVIRDTIKSVEAELVRKKYTRLILTGRDTWAFVVLCERRNIPYVYIPSLSRAVARSGVLGGLLLKHNITSNDLLLDTGWIGSIQKHISIVMGYEQPFLMMSQVDQQPKKWGIKVKGEKLVRFPNQVFPNRAKAREEAIDVEHLPKYLRTGRVNEQGKIVQDVECLEEFMKCFLMTEMLWSGTR